MLKCWKLFLFTVDTKKIFITMTDTHIKGCYPQGDMSVLTRTCYILHLKELNTKTSLYFSVCSFISFHYFVRSHLLKLLLCLMEKFDLPKLEDTVTCQNMFSFSGCMGWSDLWDFFRFDWPAPQQIQNSTNLTPFFRQRLKGLKDGGA